MAARGLYPLQEVGVLELNRNVENYFAEVEQATFEPSNVVPGIGFSPDKVLQNRVLSYADAHRYRLGSTNYDQIPVNQAKAAKAHNYHRDGFMRVNGNGGGAVDYEPNSFGGPVEKPHHRRTAAADQRRRIALRVQMRRRGLLRPSRVSSGKRCSTMSARSTSCTTSSARCRTPAMAIDDPRPIQERMLKHWYKIHPDLGRRIAEGLGIKGEVLQAAE